MKSEDLLFAAVLGILLSVAGLGSFVGHMKRMILTKLSWMENVFIYKAVLVAADGRRNSIACITVCTLKQ